MDRKRSNARNKNLSKRRKYSQENNANKIEDCSVEEERQFKLRRFVNDVNKYYDGKENQQVKVPKTGKLLNMIQSKLCTRDDLKKEMKTRLDHNLKQIIGSKNPNDNHCVCKCKSSMKPVQSPPVQVLQEEEEPPNSPLPQISPSVLSCHGITNANDTVLKANEINLSANSSISSQDLDLKLYPEFIRIATSRCSQFKADHMNGLRYARSLKEKLKAIYNKRRDCCSEDCTSDKHRSSVATSPISTASEPIRNNDQAFIPNFVFDQKKYTTTQFLQDTIGPGSSVSGSCYREYESSSPDSNHTCQAQTSQPYREQDLRVNREHTFFYPYELPNREPLPSSFKYNQMTFDGGGDRLRPFNHNDIFLPPCDEESPNFKYFPRKIF